jgi:hypothetical protein
MRTIDEIQGQINLIQQQTAMPASSVGTKTDGKAGKERKVR